MAPAARSTAARPAGIPDRSAAVASPTAVGDRQHMRKGRDRAVPAFPILHLRFLVWLSRARAEQCGKTLFAGAGEIDDAAARRRIARRPVQFGEARHDRGAERAREMMAPLAPVEASLAHRPARMGETVGIDLQALGHEAFAFAG